VKIGYSRERNGESNGLPYGERAHPAAPRAADPPRPDSARLEAATRELADLLRSTGTAGRDVIRNVLTASGFVESEISAAIGAVCGGGAVRIEPDGNLRWKEVDP
jgi:hypothetical protein